MASELISAKLPSLQLAPHHVLVRVRFAPKAEIGHSRPAHLSLDTFCKGHPLRLPGGNTHSVGNTPSIFAGNKKNRQDKARRHAVQHILRGVCWLHTTKSACEARQEASEAVLGGALWLHPGEKAETRAKNIENGAAPQKLHTTMRIFPQSSTNFPPAAGKTTAIPAGRGQKRSRRRNPRLREVSAKIGFLEPYVGQEPELIETGNREVLIFVVTILELEVKVFVEAEIGADRIHVVGSC